jgi:phosphoribosylamine---glycine ligase
VLEFNVRLGDPEAQALLMRWRGDVAEALRAAAAGRVPHRLEWTPDPAACIVLASRGYPASPVTGDTIEGLDSAEQDGAVVFHAGTREQGGRIVTSGGRVLGVTAAGASLHTALDRAYAAAARIRFEGMQYRRDIGKMGLPRW